MKMNEAQKEIKRAVEAFAERHGISPDEVVIKDGGSDWSLYNLLDEIDNDAFPHGVTADDNAIFEIKPDGYMESVAIYTFHVPENS